jgi:hypothetical protein
MSALESMIASNPHGEASIHPSLMYELPAPSTAIVDRKQHVRAYPSSASSLSANGTKTVRIRIGGEDFVDPSSIRLQYTLTNNAPGSWVRPLTGPWGLWQQVYLRSNGQELDNIPYYGRFHQTFGWNHLTREEQFGSVGVEGMHMSTSRADSNFKPALGQIASGFGFTCMHRLHLSLLSSGKLLPVKFAPLEIELSMANDLADWLATDAGSTLNVTISDVQVLMDCYTLDEAVQQSFYSALLKNRVLSCPVMNASMVCHNIPAGATSYSFSSVRAFSRLAQVWLHFRGTGPRAVEFVCPGNLPGNETNDEDVAILNTNVKIPQARLSIGPHNWPDPQPVSSVAEYYMMLTKALGTQPNITRSDFEKDCFTIVWDIKRQPQDATSAISTRSGDLVRVELSNLVANAATECWMTLVSFGVVAIRESGVTLLT